MDQGWELIENDGLYHVMPENDLKPHECHIECWCGIRIDEEYESIVTHKSMDMRELYEESIRKPS